MFKKDKQILELIFQKSILEDKVKELEKLHQARSHIESIIKRGIDWYDITKLDQGKRQIYFDDAQQIASNETFNNELHHFITDLIKFTAIESNNFEQVNNIRTGIITLETFKNRLEQIENPRKAEISMEDINNPI